MSTARATAWSIEAAKARLIPYSIVYHKWYIPTFLLHVSNIVVKKNLDTIIVIISPFKRNRILLLLFPTS